MLTDIQVRPAKPAEKSYRLVDGEGLHLVVETKEALKARLPPSSVVRLHPRAEAVRSEGRML